MKLKLFLSLIAFFQAVIAMGDIYTDPVTKVNYEYGKNGTMASVKSGGGSSAGSPDASGDVTILSNFTVDGKTYNVYEIGYEAFYNCNNITSIHISEGITRLNNYAFYGCSGITSINIPASLTSIEYEAYDIFTGCDNLISIIVEEGNDAFDSRNGCNAVIEKRHFSGEKDVLLFGCQTTVIPEGVTSINEHAFYGCKHLKTISIPNSVKSIGGTAFSGCKELETINMPNSEVSFGGYAFYGCTRLKSVNIADLSSWFKSTFSNEYSNPLYYAKRLYLMVRK